MKEKERGRRKERRTDQKEINHTDIPFYQQEYKNLRQQQPDKSWPSVRKETTLRMLPSISGGNPPEM